MKFAIIETGGKQYKVSSGQKLKIEKLPGEKEGKLVFDKVLLVSDGSSVQVGMPYVSGTVVHGKVVRQARERKKIVFKYHSKARYKKTKGHRQYFTEVEITK